MRSARVKSSRMFVDALRNFSFSYSSRAKPFTTRMARTFSSIDALSLSYLVKTARNAGMAFFPTMKSPKASTGMMTTKLMASAPPMR